MRDRLPSFQDQAPEINQEERVSTRAISAESDNVILKHILPIISNVVDRLENNKKQDDHERLRDLIQDERLFERTDLLSKSFDPLISEQNKGVDLLKELLEAIKGQRNAAAGGVAGGIDPLTAGGAGLLAGLSRLLPGAKIAIVAALAAGGLRVLLGDEEVIQRREEIQQQQRDEVRRQTPQTPTDSPAVTGDIPRGMSRADAERLAFSYGHERGSPEYLRIVEEATQTPTATPLEHDQSGVVSDLQPDATRIEEPAPETPTTTIDPQTTTQQEGARPINRDLTFGPGVDRRIEQGIASKVGLIESSFGKRLIVTSGFRDPIRNARVGGARNSAHTRGNAVDVTFSGNEQDTNKLIEVASAAGIGGIGVYRPGWVHLDTENRRVWGPDFTARSIPQWARGALDAHMTGRREDAQATPVEAPSTQREEFTGRARSQPMARGDEQLHAEPVEATQDTQTPQQPDAQPVTEPADQDGMAGDALMSGTAPAQPTAAAPQGGMQVMQASQENAVAERTPPPPTVVQSMATPAGEASPGTPVPTTQQSSTDPGRVEPEDAAERYARLFNMAA